MRTINKTILWMVFNLIFMMAIPKVYAQRTVNIQPGFGTFGSTIMGDTTNSGGRDTTTVYLLSRGGLYILDGTFSPTFPVHVQATGTGPMPRIIMGLPTGGILPSQAFQIFNSLYMKGIELSGQGELGGSVLRIIRVSANEVKVYIDSCQLDISSQSAFRIESNNVDFRLTNSIVSNIGTMVDPANGRVIDNRGIPLDSVFVQNCTFYNVTSTIYRDGGGTVNSLIYNHNTAVNVGFNGLKLGEAKFSFISNNIFKDCGFLGAIGSPTNIISLSPYPDNTITQEVIIRNNNFFTDPNISATYLTLNSVIAPSTFDSLSNAFVTKGGYTNTNISEQINFSKEPTLPIQTLKTYWNNPSGTQVDMDTVGQANFNFAYSNLYQSYSSSTDGLPLGSVSWFGMNITEIDKNKNSNIPLQYYLEQNFPNPFNPSTTIQYNLPNQEQVKLNVYNVLGQLVKTLVNSFQSAGFHSVIWDGSNNNGQKVSSGIYFYKIDAGKFINIKKMILIK